MSHDVTHDDAPEESHHEPTYSEPIRIWLILCSLTVLTVAVTYVPTHHMFVAVAMLIATVKSSLVLFYFMHLRYEIPVFFFMIGTALLIYGIFVGMIFSDYWLR